MPEELITLADLLVQRGFLWGAGLGLAVLVAMYLIGAPRRKPLAGWGVFVTAVVLSGLVALDGVALVTGVSIGLLTFSGVLIEYGPSTRFPGFLRLLGWGIAALAAVWLVGLDAREAWIILSAPVMIVGIGHSLAHAGRSQASHLIGAMFAISALGVWATVPETDMITVLVGASVALAPGTLSRIGWRMSGIGAFALAGLFVWLVVNGGIFRPPSIIAGWATIGVLPLLPLLRGSRQPISWAWVVGIHTAVVVVASRVLGDMDSAWGVGLGVLILGLASVATFILLGYVSIDSVRSRDSAESASKAP